MFLDGIGHVSEPMKLGALVEQVEVALIKGKVAEFALLRVGNEAIGHEMPFDKDAVMQDRIEPIAKPRGGGAHEGQDFAGLRTQGRRRAFAEELAGQFVLNAEGK